MKLDFKQMIESTHPQLLRLDKFSTLQINLGNRCNQKCGHCHVQAGPDGDKIMSPQVMTRIFDFLKTHPDLTVDMTGGCPELNPDFQFFIENLRQYTSKLIARTNLTIFFEPGLEWVPTWYAQNKVAIAASLPCYTQENVDNQRGEGVFDKSIKALKLLNRIGYGIDDDLQLNLVYNPGADFLPGPQEKLEADYRNELNTKYGVKFSNLFTITNAPIGRFRQFLEANGQLEYYLKLLADSFNPKIAEHIMCRNLISVDYKGVLYNCDFNQALDLPIINEKGGVLTIENLSDVLKAGVEIVTAEHCFCCTAGAGSSCTGSLVK